MTRYRVSPDPLAVTCAPCVAWLKRNGLRSSEPVHIKIRVKGGRKQYKSAPRVSGRPRLWQQLCRIERALTRMTERPLDYRDRDWAFGLARALRDALLKYPPTEPGGVDAVQGR